MDTSPVNTVSNRVTPRQRGRRNTPRRNTPGSDRKTRQQTKRVTPKQQPVRSFENSDAQVVSANTFYSEKNYHKHMSKKWRL